MRNGLLALRGTSVFFRPFMRGIATARLPLPGDEGILQVASVSAESHWEWLHSVAPKKTSTGTPPSGWMMLEIKPDRSKCKDQHAFETKMLEGGLNFETKEEVSKAYDEAIKVAYKENNKDLAAKLEAKKNEHLYVYKLYKTNRNIVEATLQMAPKGNVGDRKRAWGTVDVYVRCIFLGLPASLQAFLKPQLALKESTALASVCKDLKIDVEFSNTTEEREHPKPG